MMLTKNQIKNISALRIKKYRDEYGLFVAEGEKLVNELLGTGLKAKELYALSDVSLLPTTSVIHAFRNVNTNNSCRLQGRKGDG